MYLFIIQIILMLSLGAMIYMVARAVPRVSDETVEMASKQQNKINKFFSLLWIERIDPLLHNFLEKFLRKVRLILMKFDNIANNYLDKVRNYKSDNGRKNGKDKQNVFDNKTLDDKIEKEESEKNF